MSPYSSSDIQAIRKALSVARMSTYDAVKDRTGQLLNEQQALALYAWNAQVSAAFLVPLHICEVVVRNAVAEVIESLYGPRWPWSAGFERSLPDPEVGYSPRANLQAARRSSQTTGKVIPELSFVFWQKMFTSRYDMRLWIPNLASAFPNISPKQTASKWRQSFYDDLEQVRRLRNRIAHHETIFTRNLAGDYQRIVCLVALRCATTASWLEANQQLTQFLQQRPD
jgi:hypothetical protein